MEEFHQNTARQYNRKKQRFLLHSVPLTVTNCYQKISHITTEVKVKAKSAYVLY